MRPELVTNKAKNKLKLKSTKIADIDSFDSLKGFFHVHAVI
jgi:hypothetical protein